MKHYAILAVAVGLISAPAFAQQTQLEKSVGAPAGTLTVAEQVQLHFAMSESPGDGNAIMIKKLRERTSDNIAVTRNAK